MWFGTDGEKERVFPLPELPLGDKALLASFASNEPTTGPKWSGPSQTRRRGVFRLVKETQAVSWVRRREEGCRRKGTVGIDFQAGFHFKKLLCC